MPNLYASRDALRERLTFGSGVRTDVNAALDQLLEYKSRQIDGYCNRHFYVRTATRYPLYVPQRSRADGPLLLKDDLLAITTLKTDSAGDGTYATTWEVTTDYLLGPEGAPYLSPPHPYYELQRPSGSRYGWLTSERGNQIVGKWGYYEVLVRSTTTTAEALDTTELGVDVASGAALQIGQTILIDSEQIFISGISTNTLTVTRAVNGTTAATHSTAAVIDIYTYPEVGDICLSACQWSFEATIGRPGRSDQEGVSRPFASLTNDTKDALAAFRYRGA